MKTNKHIRGSHDGNAGRTRIRKVLSIVAAVALAVTMLAPTTTFARQNWDGAVVDYNNIGDKLWITNRDDGTSEDVYCIHPTRAYSSKGKNANYRYRYNLTNNAWMFDNSQRINVQDGIKSDYMLNSSNLERLAKVIYEGQQQGLDYSQMHKAVYWACIYGMADPNQGIRGGGFVGATYGNKEGDPIRNVLLDAYNTTQLPPNATLWIYVPESGAGNGNLQNAVNLTYDSEPANPKKVKAQFKLKKEVTGTDAPALKGGEYTFVFTGPDGYEQKVTNDADGTIWSPVLEFNENQLWNGSDGKQKTFPFVITEEEGSDPSITYDDKKIDVNVNVSKNDNDGELYLNIWGQTIANSRDNAEEPGIFQTTVGKFTNEYTKQKTGPEITNTTVTLGGKKASSDAAAAVEVPAGEDINVTLSDEVKYSDLDSTKEYTIVSTLTTGKSDPVQEKTTTIRGKSEGSVKVSFDNLTAVGEYYIKTELKADGKVVFTHNGSLDEKSETAVITQGKAPAITNTTAILGGVKSTKGKPAEYELGATAAENGVAAKFEDEVYFKDLEEGKTYTIESIVYKDEEEFGEHIRTSDITSETPSPVTVNLGDIGGFGTYKVATKILDGEGHVVAEHNGDLKENSETVIVKKSPYNPRITNTTATLGEGDSAVSASKFNPITKNVGKDETPNYKLTDEVAFWGLDPDEIYSIVSTLYKNGEEQSDKTVTEENITSTSETPFDVEFDNITETGRFTIKTELKNSQGQTVAVHNGKLNDRAETAIIQDGQELKTVVRVGQKSADADNPLTVYSDTTSFTDTIMYKDLTSGQKYEVTGTLKEINNGEAIADVATATDVFVADQNGTGTWELEFNNVTLEPDKRYVVFEKAVNIKDSKDTSVHEDPTDNAQTIITKALPKILISKNSLGGDEVPGASMKLTGGPDNIEEVWTSGTNPQTFSLKAGDYVLTEVVAPDGLQRVTTEMKFTVKDNGEVELKTTKVDNDGKISIKEGTTNHIVLEDSPISPNPTKTVNGDKETIVMSKDDQVDFDIKAKVPFGTTEFKVSDPLPEPLQVVEDSIKVTVDGTDATDKVSLDISNKTDITVTLDGPEGSSAQDVTECYGKEIVVTFKCKLDPDADLKKYEDAVNIAYVFVNGVEFTPEEDSDVKATVLGISEIPDDVDDNNGKSDDTGSKSDNDTSKTGDEASIGLLLLALIASALGGIFVARRRLMEKSNL